VKQKEIKDQDEEYSKEIELLEQELAGHKSENNELKKTKETLFCENKVF
jgi:hypothetical protein